jgi:hypothetical protein
VSSRCGILSRAIQAGVLMILSDRNSFMSNRGRQNVASFLTKDCKIDWRLGAEFFESHLIDYEVRVLSLPPWQRYR